MIDCSVFKDDFMTSVCNDVNAKHEEEFKPVYKINKYQDNKNDFFLNLNYNRDIFDPAYKIPTLPPWYYHHKTTTTTLPPWRINWGEQDNDFSSHRNKSNDTGKKIGISAGIVVILIILSCLIKCSKRNNRASNSRSNQSALPGSTQIPATQQVGISGHRPNSVSVPMPLLVPSASISPHLPNSSYLGPSQRKPPFVVPSAPSNNYFNEEEQHCVINYRWKRLENISKIPPNAVLGGQDSRGITFVGRGENSGLWYPANIVPKKGAFISVDSQEKQVENAEVLCTENSPSWWVPASDGDVPPMALEVTNNSSLEMYIGRVNYSGKFITGLVQPSKKCIFISTGGQQVVLPNYEVLVDTTQACRWVPWIDRTKIPINAVESGVDSENNKIYIGRSDYKGNMYLAKINPVKFASFIFLGNVEFRTHNAEVLVENKLCWISKPTGNGVPSKAIVTSSKIGDQDVYIGRAHYLESTYIGRIDPTKQCIYIPHRGSEVSLSDYEYLVQP